MKLRRGFIVVPFVAISLVVSLISQIVEAEDQLQRVSGIATERLVMSLGAAKAIAIAFADLRGLPPGTFPRSPERTDALPFDEVACVHADGVYEVAFQPKSDPHVLGGGFLYLVDDKSFRIVRRGPER